MTSVLKKLQKANFTFTFTQYVGNWVGPRAGLNAVDCLLTNKKYKHKINWLGTSFVLCTHVPADGNKSAATVVLITSD